MLFRFTHYLELCNAISIYYISHTYQEMLNWLFGHYKTLTNLLHKKIHQ